MDENINKNYIYCSECGNKNDSTSKFCTNCGKKLIILEDNSRKTSINLKKAVKDSEVYKDFMDRVYDENSRADFDNKDMINFIQKKVDYYIPKFKDIQELQQTTSWNWAAFFFNSWWFLYRKMYAYGFGLIIGSFLITVILPISSVILNLVIAILSGLYGNIVYLKQVQKELDTVKNMEYDMKQRILISRGGVNIIIPIILAIIAIGILLLIGALGVFFFLFTSPYYY